MQKSIKSAHIVTRFILPTSDHVERLFSISKRIFSYRRRRLPPRTLEVLLFLERNSAVWNMALVSILINDTNCYVDDSNLSEESDTE